MEICPNCGEWVSGLNEVTGFCQDCSPDGDSNLLVERYLEVNADEIEYYLLQGKSLNQAIDYIHSSNGSYKRCISCGNAMPHAPRNAVFCRAQVQCRRYARRYVYLYSERGMTKAEALAKVLEEIT